MSVRASLRGNDGARLTTLNNVTLWNHMVDLTAPWVTDTTPVVLVHGLNSSHEHWVLQVPAVAVRHPVVAYDLRGHARSEMPAAGYTIEDHVGDLFGLLEHAGIETAHLVGSSAGGWIVLQAALDRPDSVQSLTLVGSSAHAPTDNDQRQFEAQVRENATRYFEEWLRNKTFGPRYDEAVFELVMRILEADPVDTIVRRVSESRCFDVRERLGQIRCPTLIITGEFDRTTPPSMSWALREGIPDARLCLLPDVGHLPQLEVADIFNALLLRHLKNVESDSRTKAGG